MSGGPPLDDGSGAVLYGMFASFTEALAGVERRLAALEDAVRDGPDDAEPAVAALDARLEAIERALERLASSLDGPATTGAPPDAAGPSVADLAGVLDRRLAAVEQGLDALLEQREKDEGTIGRRAGLAGRRLVQDLWGRPRQPPPA